MTDESDSGAYLEGDLGDNGGYVKFRDIPEFVQWARVEREFWDFLWNVSDEFPKGSLGRRIVNHINQIIVHGEKASGVVNAPDVTQRLHDSFEEYKKESILHSSNVKSKRIKVVYERSGLRSVVGALAKLDDPSYDLKSINEMEGALEYNIYEYIDKIGVVQPEHQKLQEEIEKFKRKSKIYLDKLNKDRDKNYKEHIDMCNDLYKNSRKIWKKWMIHRRNALQKSNSIIDSLRNTDNAFRSQMILQAPVEYWDIKRKEHTGNSEKIRELLLKFVPLSIVLIILYATVVLLLIDESKTHQLIFIGAISATLLTIIFWIGRVLVRLYLSELHLSVDAWERSTMAKAFLALSKEGLAGDGDRALILGPLFRPTTDGMVREDTGIDTSITALFAKFLDKR